MVINMVPDSLFPHIAQVFRQFVWTLFLPQLFLFFCFVHLLSFQLSWQDGVVVVLEGGREVTVLSGISVPEQVPLGTSEIEVTLSGLIILLVSMGDGWIFLRSDSIWSSSTWTPSSFGFPLNVNQSLQKALGLAASESLSQLFKTRWSSSSSHPEK